MIQVINGKIAQYSLPKTGTLKNGSTVSGYHLLDEEILLDEGWLPLEDVKPEYDNETHYLKNNGYDIQADKVVKLYEVVEIPEQEPDEFEVMATQFRAMTFAVKKLIRVDELDPEELEEMIDLYDEYKIDYLYQKDDVFKYEGKLYKVIKGLTSQDNWKPDQTPSEYLPLMPSGVIPEWVKPTGGHDAYNTGDKVIFEGLVYESLIDSNTWSPTDYPAGWELTE